MIRSKWSGGNGGSVPMSARTKRVRGPRRGGAGGGVRAGTRDAGRVRDGAGGGGGRGAGAEGGRRRAPVPDAPRAPGPPPGPAAIHRSLGGTCEIAERPAAHRRDLG